MSGRTTLAVVGATGAQGGGLVQAIVDDTDGRFRARAITRDPGSDRAKALTDRGAEVVQADLDDVDSLTEAFADCHGAYCVTNFWEHFSPEKEIAQAANLARAAKRAGVRHVVWSTLEDTRKWVPLDSDRMPTLMERYKVPHFDAKGEADDLFRAEGVPTTFLLTSFYWDNLIHFGMEPQRGEDGVLTFALPMGDKALPGIAAEDIGRSAFGIFREGEPLVGETVGIAGEHLTGEEMAEALTELIGEEVRYYPVPFEQYRAFDFPGAADLGNMFQIKHDFNEAFRAARQPETARKLNPDLMDFRGWLQRYGDRIPRQ